MKKIAYLIFTILILYCSTQQVFAEESITRQIYINSHQRSVTFGPDHIAKIDVSKEDISTKDPNMLLLTLLPGQGNIDIIVPSCNYQHFTVSSPVVCLVSSYPMTLILQDNSKNNDRKTTEVMLGGGLAGFIAGVTAAVLITPANPPFLVMGAVYAAAGVMSALLLTDS